MGVAELIKVRFALEAAVHVFVRSGIASTLSAMDLAVDVARAIHCRHTAAPFSLNDVWAEAFAWGQPGESWRIALWSVAVLILTLNPGDEMCKQRRAVFIGAIRELPLLRFSCGVCLLPQLLIQVGRHPG
jgi:hypothetical protein